MFSRISYTLILLALAASLAGCGKTTALPPTGAPAQAQATLTFTAVPPTETPTPTPTPVPLAARVNGEGISLAAYSAELTQLQEAQAVLGKTTTPEQQRDQVLNSMIEVLLLAQGAVEAGYAYDGAAIQVEIDRLAAQQGSPEALADWYTRLGYDEPSFRETLARQMAAAWQRDQLAETVPNEAEQTHARQILTLEEASANRALQQVQLPGVNFAAQAYVYDPATGGDLGWFPRGYLTQITVEEAAFALQPGEISGVIKSEIGYHVLQVIARESARPLSPDARRLLQRKAIRNWLAERLAASTVEMLLP